MFLELANEKKKKKKNKNFNKTFLDYISKIFKTKTEPSRRLGGPKQRKKREWGLEFKNKNKNYSLFFFFFFWNCGGTMALTSPPPQIHLLFKRHLSQSYNYKKKKK
jgi:hypothetical protein